MAKIYSHQLQHFWETEYPEFWFYFCVLTFHWQHWLYWLFSDLLLSSLCLEMESCTCYSEEQQNDGSFGPSFSLARITSFSISSPLNDGENEPYSCLRSPVPGILQARTLEWVAISFSNAWKWKVKVKSLSRVELLATPWTAAHQAPPSMGFSRQEYWSGVPLVTTLLK